MRPELEDIFMKLALNLAERSTCSRKQVGCVITSPDYSQVYGIGYNGSAKGFPNKCDRETPGNCGCLHAEDNALLKVSEPSYVEKYAFITLSPCETCAKRIINKGGFKKVFYHEEYRDKAGLTLLSKAGILPVHLGPKNKI